MYKFMQSWFLPTGNRKTKKMSTMNKNPVKVRQKGKQNPNRIFPYQPDHQRNKSNQNQEMIPQPERIIPQSIGHMISQPCQAVK